MSERVRLTAAAKNQLVTLKRKTGISHYNALCRHAICHSLANPTHLPQESFNFQGGLEIEWSVLSGEINNQLSDLIKLHHIGAHDTNFDLKIEITKHIHRGLSFLSSMKDSDILNLEYDQSLAKTIRPR